jgi:hypothetical protein
VSISKFVILLLLAGGLWAPSTALAQGRPDCSAVLRKLHDASGANESRVPDAAKVARKLGVDAAWVERCAASYGRRVKPRKPDATHDTDGEFAERREVEEYDELSEEEKETVGDTYYTSIDNDLQDRRKLKNSRNADTINEWNPMETHEWDPNLGHEWRPYLHDDDLGNY